MSEGTHIKTTSSRAKTLISACVLGLAVVGFFTGINDGVPKVDSVVIPSSIVKHDLKEHALKESIQAVSYAEMRRSETGPTSMWIHSLEKIPQPEFNLFEEFKPNEQDKLASTEIRASRRAFNGAPPVIPHAIERTSDNACYACHGKGMTIGKKRANRMSHGFLKNCTQCHAPPAPTIFASTGPFVENFFEGMKAPLKGERAFPGAPPTIPHSTWMRDQCLSCHGREAGWAGLESTHPWRTNCKQCHAPSAQLDQALLTDFVKMLEPIPVKKNE